MKRHRMKMSDPSLDWVQGANKRPEGFDFMRDAIPAPPESADPNDYLRIRAALQLFIDAERLAKRGEAVALTVGQKSAAFRARNSCEWIYFLVSTETGMCKIGRSRDLKKRMNTLKNTNCANLELKGTIRFTADLELWLHESFAEERSHGEWFEYSDRLVEAVMATRVFSNYEWFDYAVAAGILTTGQADCELLSYPAINCPKSQPAIKNSIRLY